MQLTVSYSAETWCGYLARLQRSGAGTQLGRAKISNLQRSVRLIVPEPDNVFGLYVAMPAMLGQSIRVICELRR